MSVEYSGTQQLKPLLVLLKQTDDSGLSLLFLVLLGPLLKGTRVIS